jgi:hypothetical protein
LKAETLKRYGFLCHSERTEESQIIFRGAHGP